MVDRDLTVLKAKGGGGAWLYQFRKFKVHCAYAPEISDFPFDLQSIKVRSHAKCDVKEAITPLAGGGQHRILGRFFFRGPSFNHTHREAPSAFVFLTLLHITPLIQA